MNIEHVLPSEIEKRSFEIITKELEEMNIDVPLDRAFLVKRAIHTTADFDYAKTLYFSDDAIGIVKELIKNGATIITDTNMTLAGINKKELSKYGGEVMCFMADEEVSREAKERGTTRASISMEKASKLGKKIIFAVGNAPTALITLRQMYDSDIFVPDFVVGVPVGFVNVEVAKELIIDTNIPCIINRGRKGGSNVAAAIINALLYDMRNDNHE